MASIRTTATIDGGEEHFWSTLNVWRDVIHVRSERAVKPDQDWRHTDSHGHEHAFVDGELPTLDASSVHVPCDGSCGGVCEGEGYYGTHYRCRECGEEVEPHWVPDVVARTTGVPIPGMEGWSATVEADRPMNAVLDLSFDGGWTGKGQVASRKSEVDYDGHGRVEVELVAVSPLSRSADD